MRAPPARAWLETLDESTREHVHEFLHLLPCPIPDGETHLKRLKLDELEVETCIAVLFGMCIGFRIIGFVALRSRSNK